ncbi:MAG TPA: CopG family antitoxin [Candidatus Eisenbacteria bacterium]
MSSRARPAVFPNLKPSTETISLRLPASLLAELKSMANEREISSPLCEYRRKKETTGGPKGSSAPFERLTLEASDMIYSRYCFFRRTCMEAQRP